MLLLSYRMVAVMSLCGSAALVSAATPVFAQYSAAKVGQVGPFIIERINEAGKFERCAASLQPGANMLRISWDKNRVYSISVPPVSVPRGPLILTIETDKAGNWSQEALTNGQRAWAVLPNPTVEKLMSVRQKIVVRIGDKRFEWAIGNTSMEDVFVAIEACLRKVQSHAPAPPQGDSKAVGATSAPSSPAAVPSQVDCEVVADGKTLLAGRCQYKPEGADGSFAIKLGEKEASIRVFPDGGGIANYSDATQAWKLGDVARTGGCWTNKTTRVCAWAAGRPPSGTATGTLSLTANRPVTSQSMPYNSLIAKDPEKIRDDLFGWEFAKHGDWQVRRYTSDNEGRSTEYCTATLLAGTEKGIHVFRNKTTFELGFSGWGSAANPAPLPVTIWFDSPRASGELPVLAPLVADANGFEWRTVIREAQPLRADAIAKASSVKFSYEVDGRNHIENFSLDGAGPAVLELLQCAAK